MKRILIVDDDEFMADLYRENLDANGYITDIAHNGMDAMQRLKDGPPDLAVLDLMLPDVDGVRVLKFIRALETTRTLPVIVLSNAFQGDTVKAAQKEGVFRCLTKSGCSPKQLVKEVNAALAQAKPAQRSAQRSAQRPALSPEPPPEPVTASAIAQAGVRDPDKFQTEFLRNVTGSLAERVTTLRQLLQATIKAGRDDQIGLAMKLYRVAHSLTGMAGLAGLTPMARMSSSLELLLMDIQRAPVRLNLSSLRTMAQAVDIIALLHDRINQAPAKPPLSPLILVVDDEPLARETICCSLENVHLRAVSLGDTALALQLLEETTFDLVFLDVEMPGQNGFEICERIRRMPANRATRVVFVTAHDDFENRARSNWSGGSDFISKSSSLHEIGVKTLSYLLNPGPNPPQSGKPAD